MTARAKLSACARALFGALCLSSAAAHAQSAPSAGPSFSWVRLPGAEGCIAQTELAARVETQIGRPVFVRPADALVLIEGRVGPGTNGGFEAVIAFSDPKGQLYGERPLALASRDCRALDEVLSLVITVTLRGSASGVPLPPEIAAQLEALFADDPSTLDPSTLPSAPATSDENEPSTTAAPREAPTTTPPPTEATPAPFEVGVDAGMAVATGLQPDGTLAPIASVHLAFRQLVVLALAGGIGIAQQGEVDDPSSMSDGTLELSLWHAALTACGVPGRVLGGRLELCARFAVGRLHAETQGFMARDGEQDQTFSELGPAAHLRAPLFGPMYARLGVGLPIRLGRPKLVYVRLDGEPGTAFEVARVGLSGEVAFGITLP